MPHDARAEKTTVCTITVNSSDEKETFRRSLPPDQYRFVELVERGRSDWLESACRQGIRCDVLIVSGHYDGRDEFYSDRPDAREYLPVDEMERASCSSSCTGLFSRLKEVYLFGCNTLNPEALRRYSAEIGRSLVRSGHSPADADRISRALAARHGASSRDRMRLIFDGVPLIYGFSAKAPVGPAAASKLAGYFRSGGRSEVGRGHASSKLLQSFAPSSMTVASGLGDAEPLASVRSDFCQFADGGLSPAQRLAFVHRLLGREMAEVRMYLDRIEKYVATLSDAERSTPEVARALDEIAQDRGARDRYMDFARDADQPATRARMIRLATRLGWLTPPEERVELARMIGDLIAKNPTAADVELVCALNDGHELDAELDRLQSLLGQASTVERTGVFACLGSAEARAQLLLALTSPKQSEIRIAQTYLRHRPIADVDELRAVTARIARMHDAGAQVLALDALAEQNLSDPQTLEQLVQLFPAAQTPAVQVAIASVLIRSDYDAIARPEIVERLRESRLPSRDGAGVVDALLRRLQG